MDESHLVRPTDINGINKAAGEQYHLVYNNVFGVRACSLRLTNVYGPRQLIRHNRQGFIGWFIRLALEGGEIQIFGDGSQIRDFVYVDDVSDAFLRAGYLDACNGGVFNVGGSEPISHRDLVTLLLRTAGTGSMRLVDWPADARRIDIGSFYSDSSRFTAVTGWKPTVTLEAGFGQNVGLLSGAPLSLRRGRANDACAVPLVDARAPTRPPCGRASSAWSRAAGSCSGRSLRRSKPSSPRCRARATRSASETARMPSR